MSRIYIGNVKGPQGLQGLTGETGAPGTAATVSVGAVSTTAYGNPAQVHNSGTSTNAVLDFVIPQGQPGEEVTDMSGLTLGTMTTQTAQFPTPQIGDNGATLWGKVVKYFSDLRTLIGTKLNTSNVVNNFTTTEAGYSLDARAGKTLNDSLTQVDAYSVGDSVNTNGACVCRSSNDGSKIVADIYLPKRISVNVTGVNFGAIGYSQGYMGDGTAFTVSDITLDTLAKNNGAIRVICTPSKTLLSHAAGMVVISVPITFT